MFVFSLLMLGVLLNSADALEGTPGDQKKVERKRRDMDTVLDGLRRVTAALAILVHKESPGHGMFVFLYV